MNRLTLFVLMSLCIVACGKRSQDRQVTDVKEEPMEEMAGLPTEAPTASVIIGRIGSKWLDAENPSNTEICKTHPCEAKVEVLRIEVMGSNYYGQFEAGTMLEAHFLFTLTETNDILPELNAHFPGLEEGDVFRAEVNYPEQGPLEIGSYERLK